MEYEEHEKRAWSVDFSCTDPSMLVSGSDDCKACSLVVVVASGPLTFPERRIKIIMYSEKVFRILKYFDNCSLLFLLNCSLKSRVILINC